MSFPVARATLNVVGWSVFGSGAVYGGFSGYEMAQQTTFQVKDRKMSKVEWCGECMCAGFIVGSSICLHGMIAVSLPLTFPMYYMIVKESQNIAKK